MSRMIVCILSFSYIFRDGRVLREIEYASQEYTVDVIGYGKWVPPRPNIKYRELKRPKRKKFHSLQQAFLLIAGRIAPKLWIKAYWRNTNCRDALNILRQSRYDIIHANDLETLPVAIAAARKLAPRCSLMLTSIARGSRCIRLGGTNLYTLDIQMYFLRSFGPRTNAFVTVSEGIASLYRKHYNLDADIVMNAPASAESNFRPVDKRHIRLIHHGWAKRKRYLKKLVEMMGFLDHRYTLHFMLISMQDGYIDELRSLADTVAPKRVFFKTPVKPDQIVTALADFDIGACFIPPEPISYKYALPNKFLEAIAAGLAVVIGPSPEMARIVKIYDVGMIADGFEPRDLAAAVNRVTSEDINRMKLNALKASRSLNADIEMAKLMEIYRKLVK